MLRLLDRAATDGQIDTTDASQSAGHRGSRPPGFARCARGEAADLYSGSSLQTKLHTAAEQTDPFDHDRRDTAAVGSTPFNQHCR